MRENRMLGLGAAAGLALFALAVMKLFEARIQTGDIYPAYSSLRADAPGSRVYYDSIQQTGRVQVERRFEPLADFAGSDSTLLLLGVSPSVLTASDSATLMYERVAGAGNRVVIALPACTAAAERGGVARWRLSWECVKRSQRQSPGVHVLAHHGPEWQIIAKDAGGRPTAAERVHGKGFLVVVSDGFVFTNQALAQVRQTELLLRVLGNSRRVVFDEYHLGLAEQHGVMSLARKYRLHAFLVALLLLAALFLWRNSSSLLPPLETPSTSDEVSGRDAASGLVNLLARTVPTTELIKICVAEWKRSPRQRTSREDMLRVMDIAASDLASRKPVEAYRQIAQIVSERKR